MGVFVCAPHLQCDTKQGFNEWIRGRAGPSTWAHHGAKGRETENSAQNQANGGHTMTKLSPAPGPLGQAGTRDLPASAMVGVVLAALLGVFLIVGTGLAGPEVLHNAAHDARHGLAFPCH